MTHRIRLILLDIDGTLTDGEARSLDLEMLEWLVELNRRAREDDSCPAVTLCTGRQPAYVEAMLQAIGGHLPAIFENGCGLYVPDSYQFLPHPALGNGAVMKEVTIRLQKALVATGRAFLQPGKAFSHSIFAQDPADKPQLLAWTTEALGELAQEVELIYAASCLNVMPKGIHKGAGLAFLMAQTGYHSQEMLGVGDADNDLAFLQMVRQRAAPANANPRVKALAHYVSPYPTSRGLRDIFEHFGIGSYE